MRLRSKQIMDYSAADVKKLREETGAGFADCKTALTEAKSWGEAVKYLEARSSRKAEKTPPSLVSRSAAIIFSALRLLLASRYLTAPPQLFASVKAVLQSAKPAPVSSRNFLTSAAE